MQKRLFFLAKNQREKVKSRKNIHPNIHPTTTTDTRLNLFSLPSHSIKSFFFVSVSCFLYILRFLFVFTPLSLPPLLPIRADTAKSIERATRSIWRVLVKEGNQPILYGLCNGTVAPVVGCRAPTQLHCLTLSPGLSRNYPSPPILPSTCASLPRRFYCPTVTQSVSE